MRIENAPNKEAAARNAHAAIALAHLTMMAGESIGDIREYFPTQILKG